VGDRHAAAPNVTERGAVARDVTASSVDGIVVGVAQVGARVGDVAANLGLAARYLRRAADRGASLVVFPECFLQGYSLGRSVLDLGEAAGYEHPIELPQFRHL